MTERRHDVIIVGARCAGASLAILLARRGASVLLLDRDRLPSDQPISTHTIHPPGMDVLDELGVGGEARRRLRPMRVVRLQKNDAPVDVPLDEARAEYCPRRHRLDTLLQDAAAAAGVEVLDGTRVTALLEDGGRVVGVRAQSGDREREFRGHLVVGADGRRSTVAALVGAEEYLSYDSPRGAYWGYWKMADVWHDAERYPYEMYVGNRRGQVHLIFQTDDDHLVIASAPAREQCRTWRKDPLAALTADLRSDSVTAPLVAGQAPSEPIRGTMGERYYFRRAAGPGWALVGDAGHHKDFLLGDGITEALLQVRGLAEVIARQTDAALEAWWRTRDVEALPLFFFAQDEGQDRPPRELQCVVFEHVARSPQLRRSLSKVIEHQISPYNQFSLTQLVPWMLRAALRGRPGVFSDFLAMGKRASVVQKELEHRRRLAAQAMEAVA